MTVATSRRHLSYWRTVLGSVRWNQRLLGTTRWQVICHLRHKPSDVKGLAKKLGVTNNAIRPHLLSLERDGLVRICGRIQSGGKPSLIYEVTETAEQLFPKAFGLILKHLIPSLRRQVATDVMETIVLETAMRLAPLIPKAQGDVRQRMEHLVDAVSELGGLAELEETQDGYALQGFRCPFIDAAEANPEICRLGEVLLSEITGLPLKEVCDKEAITCRFEYHCDD